jgi:ADP-ribose pyrophosphatase YjhB (NUDIX family)
LKTLLQESYCQVDRNKVRTIRLSDEEYGKALQRFVPACADIVPINRKKRLIYLARRKSKPMTGWWWTGGGMMVYETPKYAAIRNFSRETKFLLPSYRLELVAIMDYLWKDRAQEPQNTPCHMFGYTFTVELTEHELTQASAGLDAQEYEQGIGFQAFDRERLLSEDVFPAILDLYDHLFPPLEAVTCESMTNNQQVEFASNLGAFEHGVSFQAICFKDSLDKGGPNVYHTQRVVMILVLEGKVKLTTSSVGMSDSSLGEFEIRTLSAGNIVKIPPYHVYNLGSPSSGTRIAIIASPPMNGYDIIEREF